MSFHTIRPGTETIVFTELDQRFAEFIKRGSEDQKDDLWLAAALTSRQTSRGHVCLDLQHFSEKQLVIEKKAETSLTAPALQPWRQKLESYDAVGQPGDFKPLILDGDRLYLNRYWNYERELIEIVKKISMDEVVIPDVTSLQSSLSRLFPPQDGFSGPDWQKVAALTAVLKRFCIISGSPGTGKTTIVFKILLLLLEQNQKSDFRIALAAPTGKAANRLKESINSWKAQSGIRSDAISDIPEKVFTLHRLLGSRPFSSCFKFKKDNLLPYDVVIVDEGSMVDLPLLVKLLRALSESSRLIILGDKNQLASVEAGAVLSDLCGSGSRSCFTANYSKILNHISGKENSFPEMEKPETSLNDSIVILQKNYRFDEESGISRVSSLVNKGEGQKAYDLMHSGEYCDCTWQDVPTERILPRWLVNRYLSHYEKLFTSATPEEFLSQYHDFMVLCAVRRGPFGVEPVNLAIEKELERLGLIVRPGHGHGNRPIMITANDYRLGLFNGDIGVLFHDSFRHRLDAFFPSEKGELRRISPARLPRYESAFAMTVHKSQGSEFKKLLFLLPKMASEVITRELVYTAITRAREKVEITGAKETFLEVVSRKVSRASGIVKAINKS
jgi:exodeoxyribonuclease V alpha subunit